MKYFINESGAIYAYEDDADPAIYAEGLTPISEKEALSIANPPPPQEEMTSIANNTKQSLLYDATMIIDSLSDAIDGGYGDKEDEIMLPEWKKYRYKLLKVDTSKAPDVDWPVKPE